MPNDVQVAGVPTQSGPLGEQAIIINSGTFGRVAWANAVGGSSQIIATVSSWQLPGESAGILAPNFESPVDQIGRVWPIVLPGISTGKINLEGQVNIDPTRLTDQVVTNGIYVLLSLFISKFLQFGYQDIFGYVTNYRPGSKVENQVANFTCDVMTSGIVGQSKVISVVPSF